MTGIRSDCVIDHENVAWPSMPASFMMMWVCDSQHQHGGNGYGLESAKPDLQSLFKKPGGDTAEF